MNKLVRDHYPVSKLPEDLREGFNPVGTVRVVIEVEDRVPALHIETKPMTGKDVVEAIRSYKALGRPSVTTEEAVARIRALRDEWDD
ncbi:MULTISPECIES: hypothetical protein [unclassified Rhizobium]|uniref:hypothetical protein n=1 Tax=unclassified Rhizobium TaxID=2613769 RepID=UPI0011607A12|nr:MULTISPECIES: hypothetical protein [unclassified Rhizobium]MBZ5762196.1 hypothetical protein [Rhizobium sp. VS19-DR96]MBZ5767639.1 hypothetical protein [Rhizobium sp. VS19-DR129.2]MBZ5775454.1 hypothetical protein [Rhizobium sp. VS19-DRK62.2]MBZ5786123.1 hypothetical protein [Rhizobium sp. VS19-DR121]MBZ5803735.1 hypothetical protein [Rhizobium sp. VS19-DR181]